MWIRSALSAAQPVTVPRASSSVDSGDGGSPSPLWIAAREVCDGGDADRATRLVEAAEAGEDRYTLDAVGRDEEAFVSGTPLWLACLATRNGVPGAARLAEAMVAAGADPNVFGAQGIAGDASAPLWWAAAAVEAGVPGALGLVDALIAAGADVNAVGTYDVAGGRPGSIASPFSSAPSSRRSFESH